MACGGAVTLSLALPGCGDSAREDVAAPRGDAPVDEGPGDRLEAAMEVDLLAGGLQDWRILEAIDGNAGAEATGDGVFRLLAGDPISGIRYEGSWDLPVTNYEISFDARRIEGEDFFAALTFPVNGIDTCATFIPGGWGGAVTGISCIDDIDASANETTSTYNYPAGEWFTFRIEVRPEILSVWNGSAIIARVPLAGKRIGLRLGAIEHCAPFGLASYMTVGEVRNLKIRTLDNGLLWRRRR